MWCVSVSYCNCHWNDEYVPFTNLVIIKIIVMCFAFMCFVKLRVKSEYLYFFTMFNAEGLFCILDFFDFPPTWYFVHLDHPIWSVAKRKEEGKHLGKQIGKWKDVDWKIKAIVTWKPNQEKFFFLLLKPYQRSH